jgi:hypothetical protein
MNECHNSRTDPFTAAEGYYKYEQGQQAQIQAQQNDDFWNSSNPGAAWQNFQIDQQNGGADYLGTAGSIPGISANVPFPLPENPIAEGILQIRDLSIDALQADWDLLESCPNPSYNPNPKTPFIYMGPNVANPPNQYHP